MLKRATAFNEKYRKIIEILFENCVTSNENHLRNQCKSCVNTG